MRAVVVERYGPPQVAQVRELPDPVAGPGEVLVRIEAVAVSSGDARIRGARFPRGFGVPARLALGLRGPRRAVLGSALAGRVVALGPIATAGSARRPGPTTAPLAVGDLVAGMNGTRLGAHAELVTVRADRLVRVPAGVDAPSAAGALFGGTTALGYMRTKAGVRPGESVLVIGAAGSVGSAAVQVAAHLGAAVTAVTSAPHADLVTRLGARQVVDRAVTRPAALPDRYDVVLDAVGALSRREGLNLLAPGGRLGLVAASLGETVTARGPVLVGPAAEHADDVALLVQLVADGRFDPLVEVVGDLSAAPEAYRRIDAGHKVGNLVLVP